VCDVVKAKMIEKSSRDRYFDINLQNSDTIEFRKGKGSIKPERLAMVVAWSELMCLYCRETKWEDLSFDSFRSYVRDSALTPACLKERV
jgi:thioredoxin-related protein